MMDSTNVSVSYDLESNETYHILVETRSNDDIKEEYIESEFPPFFLQENTCFENKWYYATYVSIAIIFIIVLVVVYILYF